MVMVCIPIDYVNHFIMATHLLRQPDHHVNFSSGGRKLSGAKPHVFLGNVAPSVTVFVSAGSRLDLGKLSAKSAKDFGERK